MKTLNFSSNPDSALNIARIQLQGAKNRLSRANKFGNGHSKRIAMRDINRYRAELRRVAYGLHGAMKYKDIAA